MTPISFRRETRVVKQVANAIVVFLKQSMPPSPPFYFDPLSIIFHRFDPASLWFTLYT